MVPPTVRALLALSCVSCLFVGCAHAGQVPYSKDDPDIPITSQDRVYLSDQDTNTVSVVDPSSNKLLGVIKLGLPVTSSLTAVYRGQLLVHGMGFSPDRKTVAAVCVGSNALVFIETATNKVKHTTYVGRAPHEAMWTPDGKEIWVSVRGESHIQVLDGITYEPIRKITVPDGPGMVIFGPNGKYAYICSSFSPETVVVDTSTYAIVGRVPQASVFCPNIAASPDGKQVWFTLKDTGRAQVFDAAPPFNLITTLETGPITNHVNFAITPKGQFAYISVGGLNQVKVFSTDRQPALVASIPTGSNPHAVWPSGDGTRVYVGLQGGNGLAVIDSSTNKVMDTVDVKGQAPMAMMYVPLAVPKGSQPGANLEQMASGYTSMFMTLMSVGSPPGPTTSAETGPKGVPQGSAVLNQQGRVDSLELSLSGLSPGKEYVLALATKPNGMGGSIEPVASFKGGRDGGATVATIGPYHEVLVGVRGGGGPSRYLVIAGYDAAQNRVGRVVQVQQQPLWRDFRANMA